MPHHNDVPTTCTASQLTDWTLPGLSDKDEKARVNKRLATVKQLIGAGYKLDFDIIFAITTEKQVRDYGLDDFLPKIGFELSFKGDKSNHDKHRHKETGDLFMWCVKPVDYKENLDRYLKELTEIKDRIDPPKKPDPARQKFTDLKLSHLRKAKIVFDNASVDNRIAQVLLVEPDKAALFIKMQFGIDVKTWNKWGADWTSKTTRMLKDAHVAWKAELV